MKEPLFDKPTEEVLREIASITKWYDSNAQNLDLHELLLKRNKLASLAMYLSEVTVTSGVAAQLDYAKRKVRVAYLAKDFKLGKETDKKVSDAMANNMAIAECEDMFNKEKISAGIADRLQYILRQSNTMLTVFHQTISILQKEKEQANYYEAIDSRINEIREEYDKQLKSLTEHLEERINGAGKMFLELKNSIYSSPKKT